MNLRCGRLPPSFVTGFSITTIADSVSIATTELCFDQNYYSDVFLLQPSSLVLQLKQDAAHFSCQYLAEPLINLLPFSDGQVTMTKKQKIGEG